MDKVCRIQFSGHVDHSTSCSVNSEVHAVLQSREWLIQKPLRSNITLIITHRSRDATGSCVGEKHTRNKKGF